MNKHSIDRLFKKKLSGHELPYPEHLWSSIDQRINDLPQDKRRGGLWVSWLGLGLLLLLAGSLGYYWMDTGNNAILKEGIEQLGVNESVVMKPVTGIKSSTVNETDSEEILSSLDESTSTTNGKLANDVWSQSAMSGSNVGNSQSDGSSYLSKTTTTNSTSNNSAANTSDSFSSSKNTSTKGSILQGGALGELLDDQINETLLNNKTTNSTNSNLRDIRDANVLEPCEPYKKHRTIASQEEGEQRKIADAVADLGGFGKRRFIGRWSLGLVYAPDWHFRTMEMKSPDGEALLNQRKRTETFSNAFTTGFEVRLKMRQWSVHTGLHYAQINERNKYIIDGSEQIVNGILVQGDLTRTVINRQQMIQLPILLGYEVSRGPWALEINAGASLGLSAWSSGEVFDPLALSYARYERDSDNNPYADQGRHSWQAGASLSYKMGYDYQWFIRPYYRSYFDSFTKPEYELNQNYDNIGLTVGCRYLL